MPGTLIHLTEAGRAALVSPDNAGTRSRQVLSIGIANAAFIHSDDLLTLPNEYKRIETIAGINVAPDTIHVTIRDDSADQYPAYGFGLYLDDGTLFGTYVQDAPILEKAASAVFLLAADIRFVSIDTALLTFGDASFANPPASTETQGVIEIATQAETDAGADAVRAVTPKTLATRLRLLAPLASPALTGTPTASTPPAGDDTQRLATTAFVQSAVRDASIGQVVLEPRTSARAGFLKANGSLLNRDDYPQLWAFARASGALVTEAEWQAGAIGCFSGGDDESTFRVPELRGEFLRCWDDGRGADEARVIGTYQDSQNLQHTHTASTTPAGRHGHRAWADAQGWHQHNGRTRIAGRHSHASGISRNVMIYGGGGPADDIGESRRSDIHTSDAGEHDHAIDPDGTHAHNIGVAEVGAHRHDVIVASHGATEARPRNIALLAMIRAY
ncbi:phage tail protein [Cupriavidus sp. D384]|uniref:phage tail protein n=1 Tax=Cupriavidus sp. D384 TaxID=1538095 RepID=UPI0008298374|nr:phage tail protein [Cupriavidus sp. D384]